MNNAFKYLFGNNDSIILKLAFIMQRLITNTEILANSNKKMVKLGLFLRCKVQIVLTMTKKILENLMKLLFTFLVTFLISQNIFATPIRLETRTKNFATEEITIAPNQTIKVRPLLKYRSYWVKEKTFISIEFMVKSLSGAGLLLLERNGWELPLQKVEGNNVDFNRPGNYHPVKFDFESFLLSSDFSLTAVEDPIKLKGIRVTYTRPLPQRRVSATCRSKIKNPGMLGVTFKRVDKTVSERAYSDEIKMVQKRVDKKACIEAKEKCERAKWRFPLTYCTKAKKIR